MSPSTRAAASSGPPPSAYPSPAHPSPSFPSLTSPPSSVRRYEYNFPPYLNLIHYNPWHGDNIPLACKKTASVVYFGYRLSIFALIANLGTNIALLALTYATAGDLILSTFQLIILALLSSMAFYWHYRGIAGEVRREKRLYYGLQAILCVVYIVLMSVDSNNVHGFAAIGSHSLTSVAVTNGSAHLESTGSEGTVYDVLAVSEGSLWGLTLLFSLGGMWRVYRYKGHSISFAREQPVGARTRHKKGRASALTNTAL